MALVSACLYRRGLGFVLVLQGRDLAFNLGFPRKVYTRLRGDKVYSI